jgi:serine/threonine-protein kinase
VPEADTVAVKLEQFVAHLTQSGLLTAAQITSFQDSLPTDKRPKDGEALARELVRADKLTKYQAQAVYQGKPKGLVFGEYVVLDKLGQGGMGVVLKAQHRRMDRIVAVKMILGAALKSPDAVKRFYREVKAAAKLEHPNIVAAHDAGEHQGGHYLVMQFVDGKDLSAVVKEQGPLPVSKTVDYIVQAARGLQYAHEQGIVHRDIKPGNLLLDKRGTVKILDMGLARMGGAVDEEDKDRLTASGQVMGSVDYMAPEQAMDTHQADARADIYSLGCTLYRLLTNEVLYKGDTLVKILISHQQSPIPSLCQVRPDVSPQLDAVFQKMVAKKPEDRQQTMTEVIAELEACMEKRSAPAAPSGAEPMAALRADDNLSFLQEVPPRRAATASKKKVERPAEATLSQQAAAETSRQLAGDAKLPGTPRKKKTLIVAVAVGLSAVIGIIALAVTIHVCRNGKDTARTPAASPVTAGNVAVTVQVEGGWRDSGAPPPAVAPFDARKAKQHQEAWAEHLGVPVEETNSIGMRLVLIPPGEFDMGSPPELLAQEKREQAADKFYLHFVAGEGPKHRVRITKPFRLGMYEVTQEQYQRLMGQNPSRYSASGSGKEKVAGQETMQFPVENVTWDEATKFCRNLSDLPEERAARRLYRLPTEAEREYACRAGTTTRWYFGDDVAQLTEHGWFDGNAGGRTHPVGQLKANPWGLYDMYGNVWEWCADWYSEGFYTVSPPEDPCNSDPGSRRVHRGGGWYRPSGYNRSASRHDDPPTTRLGWLGLRVCVVLADKSNEPAKSRGKQPAIGDALNRDPAVDQDAGEDQRRARVRALETGGGRQDTAA